MLGYDILLLLFILLSVHFIPQESTGLGLVGAILFGALAFVTIFLTGPLLGCIRGALTILLFNASITIYSLIQFGTPIDSYSSDFWVGWVIWIAVTFVIGWIYEKRKRCNFMLSFGILAVQVAIISAIFAVFFSSSKNTNTQDSSALITIIVLSPIIGVILAAIEAIIQAIVISILKKKQQV
jgi:biotin transporter BioY